MSVINVDSSSFYKEFNAKEAINQIYKSLELKADIIDIGAASSSPGSKIIDSKIEIKRLKEVFKEISNIKTKIEFSIDTYNSETADAALNCGFTIINDISGKPENMLEVINKYKKITYILMHSRGDPSTMQKMCNYENLILDIDCFFEERLKILKNIKTILDIGIGFAKNAKQNVELICKLSHFKHFDKPLLVGASHKSFLSKVTGSKQKEQLESTLIAHFFALQNGADILRVHDIEKHIEMIKLFKSFQEY